MLKRYRIATDMTRVSYNIIITRVIALTRDNEARLLICIECIKVTVIKLNIPNTL